MTRYTVRLPGVVEWEPIRPLLRDLCEEAYTYGYEVRGEETLLTFSCQAAHDAFLKLWDAKGR